MRKQDWIGLHVWFSLLFLLIAVVHIFFNWRPLVNYFKDRMTRRVGFRWEWVMALAICAGVYAGTRAGVPPFSTLLSLNERVKESWEEPRQRAPIPHAELLTLGELAQKAGVEFGTATNRLLAKGIKGIAADTVVQALAEKNKRSAQQIYDLLLTETRSGEGHGPGKGGGGGYGGGGGKAGGGPGRKTLTQFCSEEGIDVNEALSPPQVQGHESDSGTNHA